MTAVAVPEDAKPSHSSAVGASAADHVDSAAVAVEIAAVEASSAAHKPVAQPWYSAR